MYLAPPFGCCETFSRSTLKEEKCSFLFSHLKFETNLAMYPFQMKLNFF